MCNAEKSSSDSEKDATAVAIPRHVSTEAVTGSVASPDRSIAALEQRSRLYFRLYECNSAELVSTKDDKYPPGCAPGGPLQLIQTELLYNGRHRKDAKPFTCDELSFSDLNETAELVTDLLRPGEPAALVCSEQQSAARHRMFAALLSTQRDGSSGMLLFESKEVFTVSATYLTLVGRSSDYRSTSLRKPCALVTAVGLNLNQKRNNLMLARKRRWLTISRSG